MVGIPSIIRGRSDDVVQYVLTHSFTFFADLIKGKYLKTATVASISQSTGVYRTIVSVQMHRVGHKKVCIRSLNQMREKEFLLKLRQILTTQNVPTIPTNAESSYTCVTSATWSDGYDERMPFQYSYCRC